MERTTIEDWGRSAFAYVQARWQEHVVPTLVIFVVLLGVVALTYVGMGIFGFSFVFADRSPLYPVLGGLLGTLVFLLGVELFQPLMLGYARGTMRSMRGEGFPLSELWGGYRSSGSVILLTLVQSSLATVGMLLCVVPGLVVGLFTSLALVALADRDQGAVDALATSYELVRERFADMALWYVAMICVVILVSMIPLIGSFAATPVMTVMNVTAYLFLVKEQGARPARAP